MSAAILLVNLGTPDAPTRPAIRRYLREFLSDSRVVELPRVLWLPILYGLILPFRPRRLAHAYASVWTPQGSPLLAISRRQQAALQAALPGVRVELAMRYGEPSIERACEELEREGVDRIVVLPLYPQYSATTTASVSDALFERWRRTRRVPSVHLVADYHREPAYIEALAQSVRAHWAAQGRGEHLLVSFHSIPRRCVERGDPYEEQCRATAQALASALALPAEAWTLCYQSRIGRAEWLGPYTDKVIPDLARRGVRRLDAICPGFPADCLETLEEVAQRYAGDFIDAGGEAFRYVPALNDAPAHVQALAALCRRALVAFPTPA